MLIGNGELEPGVDVIGQGRWTKSMLTSLRHEVSRYVGALAVLDYTARHAGMLVTLQEIADESKLEKKQISSDLGAMSKATRRIFGEPRWPLRGMQRS